MDVGSIRITNHCSFEKSGIARFVELNCVQLKPTRAPLRTVSSIPQGISFPPMSIALQSCTYFLQPTSKTRRPYRRRRTLRTTISAPILYVELDEML